MKKCISKLVVLMVILSFFFGKEVHAQNNIENNVNSVVQVITGYVTETGELYVLKSGSGIVIESSTVITNYNILHLSDKELEKRKKFIKKNYEVDIDISNQDNYRFVVIDKGDSYIETSILNESSEYGFSILQTSKPMERPSAVLGDSGTIGITSSVMMVGLPSVDDMKKDENKFLSSENINISSGVVSELAENTVRIGSKISKGNSGGALLDSNTGTVLGMLVYKSDDNDKECSRALPINIIKGYLGSIAYTDADANNQVEEGQVAGATEVPVDFSELEKAIANAETIDGSFYTEESYAVVKNNIEQAKATITKEGVTQEEINTAKDTLNQSIQNLKEVSKIKPLHIVLIVVAVIFVIIIITVVIILIVVNNNKKKKSQTSTFKVMPEQNNIPAVDNNFSNMNNYSNMNTNSISDNLGQFSSISNNIVDNNATTVLYQTNTDYEQGTTVLNAGSMQITAYLIRKKNNDSNVISDSEYIIGKDISIVDYCINDNNTISRIHAKIVKKGINYLLIDMKSTNFTYINDEKLEPEKEYILSSGDMIKLSDEEFLFEIR